MDYNNVWTFRPTKFVLIFWEIRSSSLEPKTSHEEEALRGGGLGAALASDSRPALRGSCLARRSNLRLHLPNFLDFCQPWLGGPPADRPTRFTEGGSGLWWAACKTLVCCCCCCCLLWSLCCCRKVPARLFANHRSQVSA